MNASTITHVGMDVHGASIAYAVRFPDGSTHEFQTSGSSEAALSALRKVAARAGGPVRACYEAGPTGFGLQRVLDRAGITCVVVAPSLTPKRPGDRCKTDRKDARKLLEFDLARTLVEVGIPTEAEEAGRALSRQLEEAGQEIARAKLAIGSLLLRLSIVRPNKASSAADRTWLGRLKLPQPADQIVLEDCLQHLRHAEERQQRLAAAVETIAGTAPFKDKVGRLRCLKGVDTISAMAIATEMVSPERFTKARQVMSYAGLTVSEHSSGETTRRGSITKTGNAHLRRALVSAAKHASRSISKESPRLKARREGQAAWAVELARKAERRLHARHSRLVMRGKNGNVATTAVARELAGFAWAILTHEQRTASTRPDDVDADGVLIS